MNVITTFLALTEEQLISYFKEKKSTSINSAINLDIKDLKNKLDTPEFLEKDLSSYSYIKKTKDNKYYLDNTVLNKQKKQVSHILIIIILIFAISTFIATIVPSILTFLIWIINLYT